MGTRGARLTQKERDEFEALMEARDPGFAGPMQGSITRTHGFLTSVISGPMVLPSEWIPVVFESDDGAWDTMEQAQRAMSLLMRFNNEVADDLGPGGRQYGIMFDRIGDPGDSFDLADDWCRGYMLGVALRESEWREAMDAPELEKAFLPILALADPKHPAHPVFDEFERYDETLAALSAGAVEIYQWWREKLAGTMQHPSTRPHFGTVRRAAPKVSPNAPCPCGSGKKYKRCCSALRAV